MKNCFSKLNLGLCAASLFLASSTFAFHDIDDRLHCLEKEMKEISARTPQNTLGAEFRTSRPENKGTPWYLTLAALYWHPKMGGTEYAISYTPKGIITVPPIITTPFATDHRPEGDVKENDFSWDLGFKGGLGYKSPHNAWDIFARYTWFESHSTSQVQKDFPDGIIALKTPLATSIRINVVTQGENNLVIFANHAKSTVDIALNNLDLELGRSYFTSKRISAKPYISMKGTLLDLSQKVMYDQKTDSTFAGLSLALDIPELKVNLSSQFKGLGPRIGCDLRYFLGDGFNFFGDFAAALLYGHFKLKQHDQISDMHILGSPEDVAEFEAVSDLIFSAPTRRLTNKFHSFVPYAQMFLGLEWNTYMNKRKAHLGLKLGYEVQYFWRANQLEDTQNAVNSSIISIINGKQTTVALRGRHSNDLISEDLMFYGITGEARLDF